MSDRLRALLPLIEALDDGELRELRARLDGDGGDEEVLSPEEWERVWGEECERRLADWEAGRTRAITHEEFLARWKDRFG